MRSSLIYVPVSYLHECFICDAEAGILIWRSRPRHHFSSFRSFHQTNIRFAGKRAGSLSPTGYFDVYLDGRKIRIHRIIWAMHTGAWPTAFIDHRDRDKSNNPISNLREATQSQNVANMGVSRKNKVGLKGVCAHGERYRAQIKTAGRVLYLGMFDTPQDAHAAYCEAARKYHGDFAGGLLA